MRDVDVGIPAWAVRGAKVVCIMRIWDLTGFSDPLGEFTWPVFGATYTIRKVEIRYAPETDLVAAGLLLEEIVNPPCVAGSGAGMETIFDVSGFSPVKRAKVERAIEVLEPA